MCVEAVGYFRCVCPANYRIDEDTYASCEGIIAVHVQLVIAFLSKIPLTYLMYMTYVETYRQPHTPVS